MIELILVILILSILFLSFKNLFQIKNRDVIYGQTCVENLYGEINNFVKWAIRSQTISSGTTTIYPDQYLIYMMPSQNTIKLKYITSGTIHTYQTYQFTGNIPNQRYCQTSNYNILLSGTDSVLSIMKGLWTNAQHQSFRLSTPNQFTLTTDVILYNNGATIGKNIAQFLIDTRTQALQKRICLNINSTWGYCDEWDK